MQSDKHCRINFKYRGVRMKKEKKSTKPLTLTVANPLSKEKEKKMIEALSKHIEKLYYS